jgi:hypothetical protein
MHHSTRSETLVRLGATFGGTFAKFVFSLEGLHDAELLQIVLSWLTTEDDTCINSLILRCLTMPRN